MRATATAIVQRRARSSCWRDTASRAQLGDQAITPASSQHEPRVPPRVEDVARSDHEELPRERSWVQQPVAEEDHGEEDGEVDGGEEHRRATLAGYAGSDVASRLVEPACEERAFGGFVVERQRARVCGRRPPPGGPGGGAGRRARRGTGGSRRARRECVHQRESRGRAVGHRDRDRPVERRPPGRALAPASAPYSEAICGQSVSSRTRGLRMQRRDSGLHLIRARGARSPCAVAASRALVDHGRDPTGSGPDPPAARARPPRRRARRVESAAAA